MLSSRIFRIVVSFNMDLHLSFVSSEENVADVESRRLSTADVMLSESSWSKVDSCFGPHSIDLCL